MRQWENVLLLHDRRVYTEALNPVLYITEFAEGAEHFTPPNYKVVANQQVQDWLY